MRHQRRHGTQILPFPGRPLPGRVLLAGALMAGCLLAGMTGCRASRPEAAGTHISTGDVLSGRLPPQYPKHALTLEGVESSLLDFTIQSDELNRSSPRPVLTDPDGAVVALEGHRLTPDGAATTRYEGIVLLRTGTYRLEVQSTDPSDDSWYLYRHTLRFPSIVDDRAALTEAGTHPISFSAPYGATVRVVVKPVNRSGLQPELRGVVDPSGGRALDAGQTPAGMLPPQMAPTIDGGVQLVFVAPRSGRYTVLAAAKPGGAGEASINVDVTTPSYDRNVWHPGSEPSMPPGAQALVPAPLPSRPTAYAPAPQAPADGWSSPAPVSVPAAVAQK